MSVDNTAILNIFIGVFIVFVEAGLWSTISYAIYQWRTIAGQDRDALSHQQQVILRNSNSDSATATWMFSLWRRWKAKLPRALYRSAGIFVIAALHFLFFLVAMPLLTSFLTSKTGDEVLVHSPNCGWWETDTDQHEVLFNALLTNKTWEAVSYVDNCYDNDISSGLCDDTLISRQIQWNQISGDQCPFASGAINGSVVGRVSKLFEGTDHSRES